MRVICRGYIGTEPNKRTYTPRGQSVLRHRIQNTGIDCGKYFFRLGSSSHRADSSDGSGSHREELLLWIAKESNGIRFVSSAGLDLELSGPLDRAHPAENAFRALAERPVGTLPHIFSRSECLDELHRQKPPF